MLEPAKFYSKEVAEAAAKIWMPTPDLWDRVLDKLEQADLNGDPAGIDSEFYNVDIDNQSCAYRSKIHVFSVAWLTDIKTPRGFRKARGAVLPRDAMFHPRFRRWLLSAAWKVASNSPVDAHSFQNELGEAIGGLENSLSLYRWMVPGQRKYGLDIATEWVLGRKPFCTFHELVTEEYTAVRYTERQEKRCECGKKGCRSRDPLFHERKLVLVQTPHESIKQREIPLADIVPTHPRHPALVLYSADDAIASAEERNALELRDRVIPYPWFGEVA